jgi:hypothetical protein
LACEKIWLGVATGVRLASTMSPRNSVRARSDCVLPLAVEPTSLVVSPRR